MWTPIETDVCAETADPVNSMNATTNVVLLRLVMVLL